MPDPVSEQILDALAARLEGITGAYGPDVVVRHHALTEACLDSSRGETIYVLSPDTIEAEGFDHGTTFGHVGKLMLLDLSLCQRWNRAANQPFDQESLTRWTVQNELARAAEDRIRGDKTLGGLSLHIAIPLVDLSAEETFVEEWVLVLMRLEVWYSHPETAS